MIQDNNIESLEDAAKKFLKEKDEESGTMWTEDDEEIIKAFCDFSKEQYKDLIQSHEKLLIALTALVEYVGEGGTVNSYANEAIEKANSIINQQK